MSLLTTTITMFLIMNSVGYIMGYLDLVSSLDSKRRQWIVIREMFFALMIMLFFNYLGEFFLLALDIGPQTISIAGGLILFLIAIRMIFPQSKAPLPVSEQSEQLEPFIFPIAVPMIAGPSILTTIMLYAHQEESSYKVLSAILIAWTISITVLLLAENIKNAIGRRALIAIERLMGLLLTMMAVEMFLGGLSGMSV